MRLSLDEIAVELSGLGYPGFAHLRAVAKCSPAEILYETLITDDVDARLMEALPWVISTYPDLDWKWLIDHAKAVAAQNRLGFMVHLGKQVAMTHNPSAVEVLEHWEQELEVARLAKEDTFCRDSISKAECDWLRTNRSEAAAHWGLLTDLTVDQLWFMTHCRHPGD